MNEKPTLEDLTKILTNDKRDLFFPCIQDLVENGLDLTRFSTEPRQLRQDITHFLATWCLHIGLTEEESKGWLIDYCANVLSVISKTSASGIRHSAKSNLKFIYKSNIEFVCEQESNPFKAKCLQSCPVYSEMKKRSADKKDLANNIDFEVKRRPPEAAEIVWISVKEKFKKQFEEALQFIENQFEIGTKPAKIIEKLNQRGFKTKTGRPWNLGTLGINRTKISVKEKFKKQFEEALQFIENQFEIGTKRAKIIEKLNQRGFKTKTGRPWNLSTLGNNRTKKRAAGNK